MVTRFKELFLPETKRIWAMTLFLVMAFAWAYAGTIVSLVKMWNGRDDYSHGFLVPFASLYFVWLQREHLRTLVPRPNPAGGLLFLIPAVLMMLLGVSGSITALLQISIIIMIPGIVLFVLGTGYLKALALPLLYLILMVPPILDVAFSKLHWPFQLFGATVSAAALDLLRIPVFRNQQFLELPTITLEVANECSGVRFLVSIIALAVPLAYLTIKKTKKRILFIILSILVGILANPLRITLIGLWAYFGNEGVHGPGHLLHGFFVSMVGFAFLFLMAFYFARNGVGDGGGEASGKDAGSGAAGGGIRSTTIAFGATIIFLTLLGGYGHFYSSTPVPFAVSMNDMPREIASWQGRDADVAATTPPFQGADEGLFRVYRNDAGQEIALYIGYYEEQHRDKKINTFKTLDLLRRSQPVTIEVSPSWSVTVNRAVTRDKTKRTMVMFWYEVNGAIMADGYQASLMTAVSGLTMRKTNGMVVYISAQMRSDEDQEQVQSRMEAFSRTILPVLKQHLARRA